MNLKTFFTALLLTVGLVTSAQTVSGIVTSDDGPLPGATVVVKGTSNGVSTDFDGNFSINAPADAILEVSFVGFSSQDVPVNGQDNLTITLAADNELDEVVVTGYGSVTKKDATGAIESIGSDTFDQISAASPAQVLRGKVAGVQITQSNGEPGAGLAIRVRGNTSVRSGNEPLIVVDGVPLAGGNISSGGGAVLGNSSARNPLNFINQNDIESISVLKDASSTAIYGSRGANGVIIITTKKSKGGTTEPKVSYSSSYTSSEYASDFDVLSTGAYLAAGGADKGGSYNWQDTILRTGTMVNHDLSIDKNTENSNTRVSFGASSTDGIIKKSGLEKYSAAFSNQSRLFNDGLKIDSKILYTSLKDQSVLNTNDAGFVGNLIGSALYWNPSISTRTSSGAYTNVSSDYLNPLELLDAYDSETRTDKILASIGATVKISDDFEYKLLLGVEKSSSRRGSQLSPTIDIQDVAQVSVDGTINRGLVAINNDERLNTTIEHTLNYRKTFDDLIIDALVGFSYYRYEAKGNFLQTAGFSSEQINLIDNIEGSTNSTASARSLNSYSNASEIQSYFGRVIATYGKFLGTFTVRQDGSSKPGKNNKTGIFPSVGLGYKILDSQAGTLNDLKLRVNWGITGNQEFPVNSAINKGEFNNLSLNTVVNANEDLEWETTASYGVGVDFSIIENKLSGSLDYFYKDTENLIFPLQQATSQPGPNSPRFVNLDGNLINNGFEVGLNYNVLDKENLQWSISGNTSFVSNEMTNFPAFVLAGALHGQGLTSANAQVVANNSPIYSYYVFDFVGYDSDGASLYKDAAGETVGLANAAKSILDKQALPKVNVGFSTDISYKQFDMSTSFYGSFGHYLYNNTTNAYFYAGAFPLRNTISSTANSPQAASDPNSPSSKFIEKGDFLRWSNLSIGYTFDQTFVEKMRLSSLRVFLAGNNLAVFTDYSGFDPEVNVDKTLNGVPSAGIDYISYPRSRDFSIGLNLTF